MIRKKVFESRIAEENLLFYLFPLFLRWLLAFSGQMLTKTVDVYGSIKQIEKLRAVGCDLIRLAVPDENSAHAFGEIAKRTGLPLIADIHYNYKLAHLALDNGAKKIRMNPGNMQDFAQIKPLADRMRDLGVPVRVGHQSIPDPEFRGILPNH